MMTAIQPLCHEVKEKLQSGVAITGMARCVEELILNSLDAGATFIEIRVEPCSWKICVADDGVGIGLEDMRIIGERHNTSKCRSVADLRNPKTFGYRGQALASIRDICLHLEIKSCLRLCPRSHQKTFTKGVLCALETLKTTRHRPGTTITVTDLFYSVPVRKTFANTETEFDAVQALVESVALIHSDVSFVLVNSETQCQILETSGKGSTIAVFDKLFGSSRAFGFKPFEFEAHSVKFSGHIGTKAAIRKSFQFIYVNSRWLPNSWLHKVLQKMLKLSVFLSADQSSRDSSFCPTDSHGVYIINISCVMSWTDVSLLKSSSFFEYGNFQDLVDHLKRGVLEFLSRENLLDSLSTACLLRNEQRENRAGSPNKGKEVGKQRSKEGIERVGYEDNNHSISTVNIKNNQQSKLVHRFGWTMRKTPRSSCEKALAAMSSYNEGYTNKLKSLAAGDYSGQCTADNALTDKSFSKMQENECLKYNSESHSRSLEHSAIDKCTVLENDKIYRDHCDTQSQLLKDEKQSLLYEYHDLKKAQSLTEENVLGVKFNFDVAGISAGLEPDIQQRTESYCFKTQETFRAFLGNSMITGSNESSAGNSCQVLKRLCPFEEITRDDNYRFEDNDSLLKENLMGNATKRMNIDLEEVTNKSEAACDSYLSDNGVSQEGRCQSNSALDRLRNNHVKDWMSNQKPMPCHSKTLISGAKENLAAPVDWHIVDTAEAKVEGLLGMRLSSCVIIEHTSISYYQSESKSLCVRNAVPLGGQMEACDQNDFTKIRAMNSSAQRLEQRQQLRLHKHSDLKLDSLNLGCHVCFHDLKQNGKTLPDIIDLRRSGKELTLLDSLQLTNNSISNLKVICQVDRKFIAGWIKKCTESELLVFIDQHAADERIRLEQLSRDAVSMDSRGMFRVSHSVVRPMLMLCLDLDFIQVMDKFQEFFARIGLTYNIDRQNAGRLWLKTVPSCIVMNSAPSSATTRNSIKYIIQDMKETNFTKPSTAVLPKVLHNILCSQACHGAIKFGDPLEKDKCETLVRRLSLCCLPFQCAHGRPTMVPIADLAIIRKSFPHKKPTAPRLWKLTRQNSEISSPDVLI